jgi:choline-glycine betaine transporter
MKKLMLALLCITCSLFTLAATNNNTGNTAPAKALTKQETTVQPLKQAPAVWGYWVIVCIYNPVTGMFEIHMIWVEDDM